MKSMHGFTLLEVLVAFVIMGIALTALLRVFSGGLDSAMRGQSYTLAALQAESILASLGVEQPLQAGGASGEVQGYRWQAQIEPYQDDYIVTGDQLAYDVFWINLQVSWQEGGRTRSLQMQTLRPQVRRLNR